MPDTIEDADRLITQLEEKYERAREDAERELMTFITAYGEYLSRWLPKAMEAIAMEQPNVTTSLGSKLSAFKAEVRALAGRMPDFAKQSLDQNKHWSHRKAPAGKAQWSGNYKHHSTSQGALSPHAPGPIEETMRAELLPQLNEVLKRYGFRGSEYYTGHYHATWTVEVQNVYAPYPEALAIMGGIANELKKAREDKVKLAAKLAWDEA
jgi:hypothetical protein